MAIDMTNLTKAPWEWWTSNSHRRLTGGDGKDGGVLYGTKHKDGCGDIVGSETDMTFIALARNWLDIQERRKWYAYYEEFFGWWLESDDGSIPEPIRCKSILAAMEVAVALDAEMREAGHV